MHFSLIWFNSEDRVTGCHAYLVWWQKAEHTLGHDLADMEQQITHLVLEGECFSMLEGGAEFMAFGSGTNSAHPDLNMTENRGRCPSKKSYINLCSFTQSIFLWWDGPVKVQP